MNNPHVCQLTETGYYECKHCQTGFKAAKRDKECSARCPHCGHHELECGYGMAGGGMGAYMYCTKCNRIADKVQDRG